MYLTAHHVRAGDGSAGINAYLSRHSPADQHRIDWNHLDIARIVDEIGGETVMQSIELRPGGNAVLSYLDVVAPEGTDPGFIADSLRMFEHYVKADNFPAIMTAPRIGLRFGVIIGRQRLAVAEFRRLRSHVLLLLGIPSQSKVRQRALSASRPIRIVVTRDEGGEVYELTTESAERVVAARPEFIPASVRLLGENKGDFSGAAEHLYSIVVTSVTGLSNAQIGQLGGVEVVQGDRVLWRQLPVGDIPGQLLGVWFREHEPIPSLDDVPTGGILLRRDSRPDGRVLYTLDLVHVQDVWLPLSEAGVHTYQHSAGMLSGERWSFAMKPAESPTPVIFDAKLAEFLSPTAVAALYGPSAAERARPDYKTVQLELHRRQ
ncbi:MAG TPA: hypothetical protein VFK02_06325 [Kofleriaceae bacterium]|nr:hypothetical protein [Kofleriaceae bacterium]